MINDNDDFFVSKLKSKDEGAFKVLFNELFPPIKGYCLKITKDECEAEDIAIFSFIEYMDRSEKFDNVKGIKSYIYKVAHNKCIDFVRKMDSAKKYIKSLDLEPSWNPHLELEENDYKRSILKRVMKEVDSMPPQRRLIFELYNLKGLALAEVAKLLGLKRDTISSHSSLAIKSLKNKISKTGP